MWRRGDNRGNTHPETLLILFTSSDSSFLNTIREEIQNKHINHNLCILCLIINKFSRLERFSRGTSTRVTRPVLSKYNIREYEETDDAYGVAVLALEAATEDFFGGIVYTDIENKDKESKI